MAVSSFVACSLGFQLSPWTQQLAASHIRMVELNSVAIDKPLTPFGSQVLIKLNKVEDKTEGGLFVPTGAIEKPKEGTVVAAGPGYVHPHTDVEMPNPFAPGMLVLFAEGVGERVDYNREKHIFCEASAVYGKFIGDMPLLSAFEPAADRVLVTVVESSEEVTSSGIALQLDEEEKADNKGEVVAVGAGEISALGVTLPMPVSVGDKVLYARGSGVETKIEGKKYRLVSSSDCLAKW